MAVCAAALGCGVVPLLLWLAWPASGEFIAAWRICGFIVTAVGLTAVAMWRYVTNAAQLTLFVFWLGFAATAAFLVVTADAWRDAPVPLSTIGVFFFIAALFYVFPLALFIWLVRSTHREAAAHSSTIDGS